MPATATATVSREVAARSHSSKRAAVCRFIVAALVGTAILAGLVVLFFWLVVRPKAIEYSIAGAFVRHFNVTPATHTGGGGRALSATFYLTLAADNPNRRMSMSYESITFYVLYGADETQLAVADVPVFRQPSRNETRLQVRAVARSTPVPDQVARELDRDRAAGEVSVDVRVTSGVRFVLGDVRSRYYFLRAFCSPVVIGLSPSSSARSFRSVPCDAAGL